ncbi:uncharacterized protein LOC111264102 [Varroa jacobsoni]|uniref:uncharacterized protein LOC111264102 n=1 Tax=Varroa jacobsoni TaxID=62625 RepID=UPI000BF39B25|nr:uncharacterized protein LOC111264102 [Varroa jacobsoni]
MLTWMVNRKRQLDLVNVVHTPSVNPIEYQLTRTRANKGGACSAQMAIRRHKQAQTTVACIIGSGLALACLGALFVFLGTVYRAKSTPWFVAGGTCISVGLLVLLLSVETILKCRRSHIAMTNICNSESGPEAGEDTQGLGAGAASSSHIDDGNGKHVRRHPDTIGSRELSGAGIAHSYGQQSLSAPTAQYAILSGASAQYKHQH